MNNQKGFVVHHSSLNKSFSYILCWCLCLCVNLAAQTPVIDSLEQVLASGKLTNEEKAELMKDLSKEYYFVYDTAKSRMYALEAISLAQSAGLKKVEAAANIALANIYSGDTVKLMRSVRETFRLAQNNKGLELEEGLAHCFMGYYCLLAEQYYLCHVHYKKAEKLFLQIHDMDRVCTAYFCLMRLFDVIEDRENQLYYAEKLLQVSVERGDVENELMAKHFIGLLNFKENPGQEALDYFLDLYRESILIKSIYTNSYAATCGEQYIRMNRPREALSYLHPVREYCEAGGHNILIYELYVFLARAYAILPQVDSAEYYLEKAMNTTLIRENSKQDIYHLRSQLDSIKGDYRSALENYKIYHHLSDSIARAGKTTEMARLKNWNELEQKDHENQLLQQEGQKQHRLILVLAGALVMIFALLALSVFFYRKTDEKNHELKKLNTVKDKLFSLVAHDLRNPMGALMSVLKLVNKNMLDAETQAQLLKDISTRVDDTYNLIDNLLHWSKSQMQGIVPSPAYFDVQDGSLTVTDSLQHIAAAKAISLANCIEKQQVYADRDMFSVVVRNLCMNAIKYTSAGGEVTLASELSGNTLIISVKDNGTGMTQEVQDQLFKLSETKSRRGTNNESGTGLGLVLCADFVKINGGSIWFTSKQDEGSTFFFSLPVKGN